MPDTPDFMDISPEQLEAERQRNIAEIRRLGEPLMKDIWETGCPVASLSKLCNGYKIDDPRVASILLEHLERTRSRAFAAVILACLYHSKVRFDGRPITRMFDDPDQELNRWDAASVLANGKAKHVEDWIPGALANPAYGKGREMLCLAAARLLPKEQAREVLRKAFPEFPGHVPEALALVGTEEDVAFLESQKDQYTGWVRKEIQKSGIDRLRRRLEKKKGTA